jgi:hypothetical protein
METLGGLETSILNQHNLRIIPEDGRIESQISLKSDENNE